MQDKMLELWVRAQNRLAEDRGQTAAEYMGILFIVAIIIGALVTAKVHEAIADAAGKLIDEIAGGGKKE